MYLNTGVPVCTVLVHRCTSVLPYRCTMSQNRNRFMHRMSDLKLPPHQKTKKWLAKVLENVMLTIWVVEVAIMGLILTLLGVAFGHFGASRAHLGGYAFPRLSCYSFHV